MLNSIQIQICQLPHAQGLPLPTYGTPESAGADLYAAVEQSLTLQPGERTLIPTGLQISLQPGMEAQIRSRSGLSLKHGITVLNSPATIDPDYRGEVKVILMNQGQEPFLIERGMRIAQLVIAPFYRATWTQVAEISSTTQRGGGFGSTGLYEIPPKTGTDR